MAKLLLLICFITSAHAQIFSNPFSENSSEAVAVDKTMESLAKLDTESAGFEERFKQLSLEIERQLDIMRSDCQEKFSEGSQRQRCFRDVVARHKKYLESSYEAKKTLLTALHKRQLTQLQQGRDQALKELDKQF